MKELILLILLCFFSCNKQDCLREFEFHFPATITEGDTFAIGDTLWMRMDLPNELMDYQTGELIDLSKFDLYFDFNISKLDSLYVNTVIDNFELIQEQGTIIQKRNPFVDTHIHFNNINYKELKFGLVPQIKGSFFLALQLPILEYRLAETAEKKEDRLKIIDSPCSYQDITKYSGVRFNAGRINYYLIAPHLCQQASPTDPLIICNDDSTTTANRGGYAFVVR